MADQDMTNASQKIAENVLLLAIARISMALVIPIFGALFWLYSGWQGEKLEGLERQVIEAQQSASDASHKATTVSDRLIAVETKQVQDAASSERFQTATLSRLDRVQDSIVGLSNAVAALTATVQAIADEKRQEETNRRPP